MELTQIKGIGKKRIEALTLKGINNSLDLVSYLPFQYLNMSQETPLSDFVSGKDIFIRAKVTEKPTEIYFRKIHTTRIIVQYENIKIVCMWFNQPYVKTKLNTNEEYFFFGKLKENDGKFKLLAPSFESVSNNIRLKGLVPKYRKIDGLGSGVLSTVIKNVLDNEAFTSIIPRVFEKKYNLLSLYQSYYDAHFPQSMEQAENAFERIQFEKVVHMMLSYKMFEDYGSAETNKYIDIDIVKSLEKVFPFELYASQKLAISEISKDMRNAKPMNRLLQGDVGSGKSVVMFGASLLSAKSKKQTAIMCPTTTLALQHFATLKRYSDELGIKIILLNSESIDVHDALEKIENGEIDIVIGTHSLISERVKFKSLGLVVIDEQQKFGVGQRAKLVDKGKNVDLLTVTATPIPRSLALILYGEINITYISKDAGANNIKTYMISNDKLKDCKGFLQNEIAKGGFLYIVCPKIYDEELNETAGVIEKFNEIKREFNGFRIGLLHGDLNSTERMSVTDKLLNDKLDILVSTSIIEVGIDNSRANLMLIFQAENFGLSSLHQLRGRIGRRGQESFCFLSSERVNEKQNERLRFFKDNADGFKIADYDLEMRGAGEYFGTIQHGKNGNEVFSKMTFEKIRFAKSLAEEIIESLSGSQLTLFAKSLKQFVEKPTFN